MPTWNDLPFGDITKASRVDEFGQWDYAVPHDWLMEDPENRRHFCWFYPHDREHPARRRRRPWSRPLSYRTLARLALAYARRELIPDLAQYAKLWAYVHPGKAFDLPAIESIRRHLIQYGDLSGFAHLFRRLEIPEPPPEILAQFRGLAWAV